MPFTAAERPRGPSRIHGPRRILRELRRIRLKADRAQARPLTVDEQRWCHQVADAIDRLLHVGDAVLPGQADPRDAKRARKRTQELF